MHSRNHSHPFMLTANTAPIKGSVHHHMVSHHQKSNDMGLTWVIVLFQTILQARAKKKTSPSSSLAMQKKIQNWCYETLLLNLFMGRFLDCGALYLLSCWVLRHPTAPQEASALPEAQCSSTKNNRCLSALHSRQPGHNEEEQSERIPHMPHCHHAHTVARFVSHQVFLPPRQSPLSSSQDFLNVLPLLGMSLMSLSLLSRGCSVGNLWKRSFFCCHLSRPKTQMCHCSFKYIQITSIIILCCSIIFMTSYLIPMSSFVFFYEFFCCNVTMWQTYAGCYIFANSTKVFCSSISDPIFGKQLFGSSCEYLPVTFDVFYLWALTSSNAKGVITDQINRKLFSEAGSLMFMKQWILLGSPWDTLEGKKILLPSQLAASRKVTCVETGDQRIGILDLSNDRNMPALMDFIWPLNKCDKRALLDFHRYGEGRSERLTPLEMSRGPRINPQVMPIEPWDELLSRSFGSPHISQLPGERGHLCSKFYYSCILWWSA